MNKSYEKNVLRSFGNVQPHFYKHVHSFNSKKLSMLYLGGQVLILEEFKKRVVVKNYNKI